MSMSPSSIGALRIDVEERLHWAPSSAAAASCTISSMEAVKLAELRLRKPQSAVKLNLGCTEILPLTLTLALVEHFRVLSIGKPGVELEPACGVNCAGLAALDVAFGDGCGSGGTAGEALNVKDPRVMACMIVAGTVDPTNVPQLLVID